MSIDEEKAFMAQSMELMMPQAKIISGLKQYLFFKGGSQPKPETNIPISLSLNITFL